MLLLNILEVSKLKSQNKLIGFKLLGAGVAREGCGIYKDGVKIGALTSATYSPLFKAIGCGYVPAEINDGDKVEIEIRGRMVPAQAVKMPFYKNKV